MDRGYVQEISSFINKEKRVFLTPSKWIGDKRNGLLYVLYFLFILFSLTATDPLHTLLTFLFPFPHHHRGHWNLDGFVVSLEEKQQGRGNRPLVVLDWPRNGWEPTVLQLMGSPFNQCPLPMLVDVFGIRIYKDFFPASFTQMNT